jgi:hypothetical protein
MPQADRQDGQRSVGSRRPWEHAMRARRILRSALLATSLAGLTLLTIISTVAACTNGNGFP